MLVHWHWMMSEMLLWCLRGRNNGTPDHSLMTLMWLVNNIMIEVLPSWRKSLSLWSKVFKRNTNESWVWWPLLFCCYLGNRRELCFNVTCQFCMGVSPSIDYVHVKFNYEITLLSKTSIGKCILQTSSTFKVLVFVGFCGYCVSALCACAT